MADRDGQIREYVERTCEAQGVPVTVDDPAVLADLSKLARRAIERRPTARAA